jgi:glycosyltransferase involved in cell wall biosynthesis
MRVTLAGYQAVSILHGGPSTQIRNTAKHLPKFGVEVRFFDPWAHFKKEDTDLFHIFAANIGTYHLAREIHSLEIPLIVSPIVYSLHSPAFVRRTLRWGRLLQRAGKGIWFDYGITAEICQWAAGVLPNTVAEGKLASEGLGVDPGRISVVPNGVDERFYTADPTPFIEKYGIRDFILNVGHTGHARKNALSLIKALAMIDHPAVIIGRFISGEYGDACRREAAKHRHILLIDGLDHSSDMLASAYAACDTFVLPSMFETPGIAALEAALAGAKVVITPYGGTKEYFGDRARYVDPASVSSIRDGIVEVLGKKKGTDLREHVRRNYLWQTVAQRTAEAYRTVQGQAST